MRRQAARAKPGKAALRARAEKTVAAVPPTKATAEHTAEELLYQLQVHQVELEMQNEELRRAQLDLEESRDRYLDLYEFAPVGYFTLTDKGLISEVNLTGATLLGEDRGKMLRRRFGRFVAAADSDRYRRLLVSALEDDERKSCDLALQRGDGTVIHAQLDGVRVTAGDGPPTMRLTLTDITERKRVEAELRVAATAFETQEGMVVTDAAKTILRVNGAFIAATGFSATEVVGKTPGMFKSGRHDEVFYDAMWKEINRTGGWQGEVWNLRKDGKAYPSWVTISVVKGDDGAVTHYVGSLIDITQRKTAAADIEQLAFYDPLTGLPNRRLLLNRLQQALAARPRSHRR
ncbi:MAG: PAS domain S-box protein, partial [Candidatus Eisenbacteria bacterium]